MEDFNPYSICGFICGCLIIPIAIMGIFGNALTIYIFSRPTMSSSINFLLSGLAAIDIVLLFIGTPIFSSMAIYAFDQEIVPDIVINYFTITLYPIAMMAQTGSVWSMVVITLERYLAICWPFRARSFCSMKHAKVAFICIIFFSVCYNIVRFWEYEYFSKENRLQPLLKSNTLYMRLYIHWMYFVLIFLLPFLVLLIFNVLVVRSIQIARQHRLLLSRQQCREHNTALMMIILVLVFFFCNVLAFILNAIESVLPTESCKTETEMTTDSFNSSTFMSTTTEIIECMAKPNFFLFLEDLNNLLIELNSSVNFFIYFAFSNRFRSIFKKIYTRFQFKRSPSQTGSQDSFYSHTSYVQLQIIEAGEK